MMRTNRFEIFSTSISQLIRSVQQTKNRKIAQYGLKGTNALCLCHILEHEDGLSAAELSRLGEIDKAQVSRCMSELIARGFVYRNDQEGRRYKQKYCLTEEGAAVATDIAGETHRIQQAITQNISPEDLDIFYKTLAQFCENFAALVEKDRKT